MLAEHGLDDLGHELLHLSRTGGWDQMASRVSDDVVRLFAAVGRFDELAGAITDRFGGLSDAVGLTTPTVSPTAVPPDLIQDLQALPTPFTGW